MFLDVYCEIHPNSGQTQLLHFDTQTHNYISWDWVMVKEAELVLEFVENNKNVFIGFFFFSEGT